MKDLKTNELREIEGGHPLLWGMLGYGIWQSIEYPEAFWEGLTGEAIY